MAWRPSFGLPSGLAQPAQPSEAARGACPPPVVYALLLGGVRCAGAAAGPTNRALNRLPGPPQSVAAIRPGPRLRRRGGGGAVSCLTPLPTAQLPNAQLPSAQLPTPSREVSPAARSAPAKPAVPWQHRRQLLHLVLVGLLRAGGRTGDTNAGGGAGRACMECCMALAQPPGGAPAVLSPHGDGVHGADAMPHGCCIH